MMSRPFKNKGKDFFDIRLKILYLIFYPLYSLFKFAKNFPSLLSFTISIMISLLRNSLFLFSLKI